MANLTDSQQGALPAQAQIAMEVALCPALQTQLWEGLQRD
jgi:hypothetical protein